MTLSHFLGRTSQKNQPVQTDNTVYIIQIASSAHTVYTVYTIQIVYIAADTHMVNTVNTIQTGPEKLKIMIIYINFGGK